MRRSRSLFRFVQAGTFFVPIPPQRLTGCQGAAVSPLAPPAGRTNSQRRMRAGCQWDGKALAGNGRHVCVNRSLRRGRGFGKDRRWSKSEKGEIEYNALGHFMSLNHAYEQCLADNVVISQEVPGGLSCRRSDQEPTGQLSPLTGASRQCLVTAIGLRFVPGRRTIPQTAHPRHGTSVRAATAL